MRDMDDDDDDDDDDLHRSSWSVYFCNDNRDDGAEMCECLNCSGQAFGKEHNFQRMKVRYEPFWAYMAYDALMENDSPDALKEFHPLHQLALLGQHAGLELKSESDQWWWARFILLLTPGQTYDDDDVSVYSGGHFCDLKGCFVNDKSSCSIAPQ